MSNQWSQKTHYYTLWHKYVKKYVPFNHGKHKLIAVSYKAVSAARFANLAWGGTDVAPVLELHLVSKITNKTKVINYLKGPHGIDC